MLERLADDLPAVRVAVQGRLRETVLRGQVAYKDGAVLAEPESGRLLTRYEV